MFNPSPTAKDHIQGRLLSLAAMFLGLYALILTLAPAARARSWAVEFEWGYWIAFIIWLFAFTVLHRQTSRFLPDRDAYLLPVAGLLTGWGTLTVWRIFPSFGLRQTLWLLGAAALFVLGLRAPSHLSFLRRYKYLWLTSGLILTGLTLIFGTNPTTGTNPRLWLGCCGVYFQPSEPLKLLLILYLSAYLADRLPFTTRLLPLLAPTLVMTGLTLLLLLVQRDLGTASIFILLFAAIVYVGTGRKSILVISALTLAIAGAAGYVLFDVVRLRVDAWLNPWLDPSGRSYQIVQSLLAVANGGILGRGPGLGNPNLVPIPHSDFVFAAITEETGLIGAIGLLVALAILAARGVYIAIRAPDSFRRFLAAGLSAYLIGQSVVIIGGNLRLVPLTGVTLPFVSYGGSSLLTAYITLLLLLHISNQAQSQAKIVPGLPRYLQLSGFLFTGLAAAALVAGWWAVYRGPGLLERTDNPRRAIADRYVPRGEILDRRNQQLAVTQKSSGEYFRQTLYPSLGPVIGYTNAVYGQSGLEASLDPYLRGLRGNPALTVWWHHLLYGQPPPGLDVRLTLDLNLQNTADQLLAERRGALVLLNSQSGEILAMASHPTFDPNLLDQNWTDLVKDPSTPLLNRATLGRYQPGPALAPLLYAAAWRDGKVPSVPQLNTLSYQLDDLELTCALQPQEPTWNNLLAGGCPTAQLALAQSLGKDAVLTLYKQLGFYTPPSLRLPTDSLPSPLAFDDEARAFLGQANIAVSPLQMALAAGTISTGGIRPAPRLASAVNTPKAGWVVLPALGEPAQVFQESIANQVAEALTAERLPVWQVIAATPNGPQQYVTWYVAGTLPTWTGDPLTLVIVLEENNPELAQVIGRAVLQTAIQP
ncbi:MAG: FtsW/RodA/SpoVE family cell cycle protein [Anaerolineales bacterium]